ncbi:MAG: hypothetical protein HEP70_19285 [Rhodobiaceae bacterium]|uniref:Secreted protein n=1 Tax=Phaeobacter piscinae TaxID=1580596 RepID=A0ABN5DKS4_9RHOB|nr:MULTISPECIES: hypothetical protein [Rhodobacterales]ATG37966.1 hypothetical protein PhaeoP36_03890 [Phaeobacter piscinae]AUQ88487.1 hypothetical protein PhaeoP42_03891 [Phaeobacter piscinae]MCE8000994.1 hypothetical protein [Rhodobiaceae bacterium]|tara:strand:+ start:71 stop:463 length:393 start_codon:yes stop_codon:yes gene_type:complete
MKKAIFLCLALSIPTAAAAQFVPSAGSAPRICPNRIAMPDWLVNFDVKDAHKINLVQEMYRAQSMTAIVETGDCSCETRFPSWTAASDYYFAHYAGMNRHEILERTSEYRRTANEQRRAAQPVCEAQGNW